MGVKRERWHEVFVTKSQPLQKTTIRKKLLWGGGRCIQWLPYSTIPLPSTYLSILGIIGYS